MSESREDTSKLKTSTAEFNAISPLEPLDPNKFRNIMLDKPEIQTHQPPQQQSTSSDGDYAKSNPEIQSKTPDIKPYQSRNQPFTSPQNPASNPPNPAFAQQAILQQQNVHHHQHNLQMHQQQQQQYFPQQSLPMPQQYGMPPFSGMPPMVPMVHAMPQQQQQPHPNYIMQSQQWVPHQQMQHPQNPQLYHNVQQARICSPQHNPALKQQQMPPPPYNVNDVNAHMIPYPQHQPAPPVQRQMSQDFYSMPPQTPHPHQAFPPQYGQPPGFGGPPYGYCMDSRQHDFPNQRPAIQSPPQIQRPPLSNHQPEQLRSPQKISNTAFIPQQRPQILRMPVSMHHQHQPPQFIGHEHGIATTLNPDICLAGCVFLLVDDCNPKLVDCSLLPSIIRFYGGDVESNNPRGIPDRVTHLICSSWLDNEPLIQQALSPVFIERIPRKLKRIVTVHWLNDAIEKRRVDPPTKACHLPCFWSALRQNPQITSKIISISGFCQQDKIALKYMIEAVGARFCPLTSKTCILVVNKNSTSPEIIQRARENGIQLVNCRWLFELYFGNVNVLSSTETQRFLPENEQFLNGITTSPQTLAKMAEFCHKLMLPWIQPIMISDDIVKTAYESKRNIASDTNIFPEKMFSIADNAPTEEQIKQASSLIAAYNSEQTKVNVLIEGFYPEQIENLSKKVRFLGGKITDILAECTHFVTANLRKSVNLVEAIALGKHVVTPLWIETSFKRLEFVDPLLFFVKDRENERKFGFNLKATILRVRNRKVFQDVCFHLSNGVQPSYEIVKRLVESAGGLVESEPPKKKELLQCIQNNKTYFIICNRNDLNFYQYLVNCNFPLFNEDFVLMSILRHKIDLSDEFHTYPSISLPILPGNKKG